VLVFNDVTTRLESAVAPVLNAGCGSMLGDAAEPQHVRVGT